MPEEIPKCPECGSLYVLREHSVWLTEYYWEEGRRWATLYMRNNGPIHFLCQDCKHEWDPQLVVNPTQKGGDKSCST